MIENDFELIHLAQEKDEDAINAIYEKYKPIIIKKSKLAIPMMSHHGIEINDIMQEAYIGLSEAIEDFKENDDTSFYTFANLCIDRKIANYIKKSNASKERILNEAVYIDETLENVIPDSNNTEENFVIQENNNEIIKEIYKNITPFEKKVLDLKLEGYTLKEISETLNRDLKSVYNTIHRIKEKIQKLVGNEQL